MSSIMKNIKEKMKSLLSPSQLAEIDKMMYIRKKCMGGGKIRKLMNRLRYNKYCSHFGCFIPFTAEIGENIIFPHGAYGVFISQGAKIGNNCVIFHQVTIGSNTLADSKGFGAPTIGNNVYIGTGAKIIGNVKIGNNVRIGANAVVVKDIPDNATVIVPDSRIINHKTIRDNTFIKYNVNEG